MKFKSVLRYDPTLRAIRLGRLMWTRGTVGDGKGYSVKLSVALAPSLFLFARDTCGWTLRLLGLRLHMKRSYGGIHV